MGMFKSSNVKGCMKKRDTMKAERLLECSTINRSPK
jgi:hypothetical protein